MSNTHHFSIHFDFDDGIETKARVRNVKYLQCNALEFEACIYTDSVYGLVLAVHFIYALQFDLVCTDCRIDEATVW